MDVICNITGSWRLTTVTRDVVINLIMKEMHVGLLEFTEDCLGYLCSSYDCMETPIPGRKAKHTEIFQVKFNYPLINRKDLLFHFSRSLMW